MLDDEAVAKSGPHTDGSPAWSAVSDDALQLTRPASFSPVSVASHKSMRRSVLDDAALPTPAVATTSQNTSTDIAGCRDSTVLSPSRMYKVLEVLHQRTSFSSSNISDILSLIDRRLSLSTLTSSRRSMFAASIAETELSYAEGKAAEVVERVCQTITRANLALIEDCCGNTKDCRHRFISKLSDNDPHLIWLSQLDLDVKLTAIPVIQSSQDSYGNSELFFAARIGAAADVILSLLRVTDNVNAVNADGQTFLYFLNPRFFHFQGPHCRCVGSDPHRSRFECLVRALHRQGYNFDLLDNYGRPFLFFLCASPHFDYRWLLDLMLHDNEWRNRVRHISQLRDANGLFLIDFMVLHPAFDSLDEGLVSQFRPLFSYSPNRVDEFEVLHNEDKQGRSRLHQYVQGDWLHEAPRNEVAWPFRGDLPLENVCDINRYDGHGRTPIMDLLLRAFDQSLAEDFICAKVKLLLVCGANVNARSRGGSTVLHFAAKKAMPLLLQMLLETNIQVDHRDEAGLSALDYAAKVLQRSRSVKSRVELMARSLKSTAQLLSRERAMDGQRATKDVHVRIQQTLQQLSGTQQQNYPPSLPKGFPRSRR